MGQDRTINILDMVYPVGSVYTTIDPTFNPNTAFGGTWEVFATGRCLLGVALDSENVNRNISPKLPNITGTFGVDVSDNVGNWTLPNNTEARVAEGLVWGGTGALGKNVRYGADNGRLQFYHDSTIVPTTKESGKPLLVSDEILFDANKSCGIYTKNNTTEVIPNSVGVIFWRRIPDQNN